jgi:hypothetical protein
VTSVDTEAFIVAIEGIEERSPDGVDRKQYCAQLTAGTELKLHEEAGVMQVMHLDCMIGRLSAQDRRIVNALAKGRGLRCVVAGIEVGGLMRRRVRRVEVEIMPLDGTHFTAAARRLAEGSAAVLQAATNITVSSARAAGDHLVVRPSRAAWRGTSFIGGLLLPRSARLITQVGRSVGNAAGAPVRAMRRMIRNLFFAAVTILVLILAIVVIWRLPSLPGIGPSLPQLQQPRP